MFFLSLILFIYTILAKAANFSFSYTNPRACDQFTVTWQGGEPPYSLFITPKFSVPVNISIPGDAPNSFTTTLPLNESASFLLTMSDKNGFGTGGTSPVLTPTSTGNNSCQNNTHPQFTFSLPSALRQCNQFKFTDYNRAVLPVEFIGIIPQGEAFPLITKEEGQFTWTVDVKAGTQIIWIAQDAQGRTGGTSDLLTVQLSESSNCLNTNSPSSTATFTPTPSRSDHSSAILGGAIGGGLFAVLILGGALFLWLKKRHRKEVSYKAEVDFTSGSATQTVPLRGPSSGSRGSRMEERNHVQPMQDSEDHSSSPFVVGSGVDNLEPNPLVFSSAPDTESSDPRTRRSSKAGMMSRSRTPRFILHTDAEDVEDEEEVVELPPQYRPSHASPLPLQPTGVSDCGAHSSNCNAGPMEARTSYPLGNAF